MDVRCEKCQTEYELDEARLKPSGVTVKCTNCGHMFKIRKRSTTNAGVAPADRSRTGASKPPTVSGALRSAEQAFGEETAVAVPKVDEAAVASGAGEKEKERQWLIRLENGEQKSCRELASLQQWIVAGIVTRESLISRTGKTWKRLGDIGELAQYFTVADETRAHRNTKQTGKTVANKPAPTDPRATMLGFSGGQQDSQARQATSAGGTILPDDDVDDDTDDDQIDGRNTGEFAGRSQHTPRPASMPPPPGARTPAGGSAVAPPPPPGKTNAPPLRTPPLGSPTKSPPIPARSPQSNASATLSSLSPPAPASAPGGPPTPPPGKSALATSPTEMQLTPPPAPLPAPPARRPLTTPPPPPPKRSEATPPPIGPSMLGGPSSGTAPPPPGNRATAMWATDGIKPKGEGGDSTGPSGPRGGKLSAIPDEPAFAGSFSGRVRTEPTDASVFSTGKIKTLDDDDDALPARRGSRAGTWIALIAIVVIGASAATIYAMMKRSDRNQTAGVKLPPDAAVVAIATDASIGVTPIAPDAGAAAPATPFAAQRAELLGDVENRLLPALLAIQGQEDPPSLAMRAHLGAAVAQALRDRAGLDGDKAAADKLRANADKVIVDAASLAPRALKAAPDDPTANLAMAEVLRLQKKPARDIKRYLDAARGKLDPKSDPQLAREIALAEALVLARDGKLEDARSAFTSIDQGDGKLETSGDVRARYHVALALLALDKPADAKPLVDQILAAQPEHAGARALAAKLATTVTASDPLPPEEHRDAGVIPGPGPGSAVAALGKDAGVAAGSNDLGPGPAVPTGDYNKLVQQGNKLAESNCTEATKVFQRALDQNPAGADALTGIGYCQLDAKQFSSAYSKFSAALAVDPRNEGALSGIAEMYQQQGRKDKALEAWKAYQAVYPGSPKAQKQIDRLNGAAPPPPPETPPVTPTPTPTPAPEAGSDGT